MLIFLGYYSITEKWLMIFAVRIANSVWIFEIKNGIKG